jgi:anti-sigma factor RsiW
MDCEQMERVSQLIDGELTDEEAAAMSVHLAACQICSQAHADFLRMRNEITVDDFQLEPFAKERALRDVRASLNPPIWRKRISVPVPTMAVLLIALVGSVLWSLMRFSRVPADQGVNVKRVTPYPYRQSQDVFDLSRFDHGDRVAIQKIKRVSSVNQ